MPKDSQRDDGKSAAEASPCGHFSPGAMVVVTLGNPRDKFWGRILALAPEGLSMSGIELDLPDGSLPSLSQRFSAKTGLEPAELLNSAGVGRKTDHRATVYPVRDGA